MKLTSTALCIVSNYFASDWFQKQSKSFALCLHLSKRIHYRGKFKWKFKNSRLLKAVSLLISCWKKEKLHLISISSQLSIIRKRKKYIMKIYLAYNQKLKKEKNVLLTNQNQNQNQTVKISIKNCIQKKFLL